MVDDLSLPWVFSNSNSNSNRDTIDTRKVVLGWQHLLVITTML